MTEQVSLTTIAICQIVFAALFLAAMAALLHAILALKRTIDERMDEAVALFQPTLHQAQRALEQVESVAEKTNRTIESVGAKVDSIAARAETTADRVGESVESVAAKVQEAMSPQVVAAAGIAGTAVKCVQLYKDILELRKTLHCGTESDETEEPGEETEVEPEEAEQKTDS